MNQTNDRGVVRAALVAAPLLGAVLLLASPNTAQAQLANTQRHATTPPAETARVPNIPPPALPGARSPSSAPALPDRPVTDMPPTEALFDAINRGDINNARDAIGRGADLGGRNILGLTPVDLSVDLGRNDITFLLLSLRGATPTSIAPNAPNAARGKDARPAAQATAAQATAAQATSSQPKTAPARAAPRQAKAEPIGRQAMPNRNQYVSSDPGTPAPQVGFLGFGRN